MTIEARGLGKTFATGRGRRARRVEAVRDVSFAIGAGERVAYIGPNGELLMVQSSPGFGLPCCVSRVIH